MTNVVRRRSDTGPTSHADRQAYRHAIGTAIAGLGAGLALMVASPAATHAQAPAGDEGDVRATLEALAALPGEPGTVSAAGTTRDDVPLLTLENGSPFDASRPERRIVLVGGLNGDAGAARIVLDAIRWFKTEAPESERARWLVSALPQALPNAGTGAAVGAGAVGPPATFPPVDGFFDDPDRPESRYVWRWVTYQAPDLVVEVRAGEELQVQYRAAGPSRGAETASAAGKGGADGASDPDGASRPAGASGAAGARDPAEASGVAGVSRAATTDSPASSRELPAGSLTAALADAANNIGLGPVDAMLVTARASDGAAVMREVLRRAGESPSPRSPLRVALERRMAREPLDVARLLSRRYPGTASISYIPALAWVHTLRLAEMDGDAALRAGVLEDVRPWLSGEQSLFGDRTSFAAIAGTMIFSAIARHDGRVGSLRAPEAAPSPLPGRRLLARLPGADRDAANRLAAEGAALAAAETAPGVPRYASGWSDDFYLGTIAAVRAGDPEALDAAVRLVTTTAARLQQPSGLFHHDAAAPTAWGRGNGFGALGLSELLTVLPPEHPERGAVLDIHRRHLAGLRAHQAADGMWHQIVDVPGSYRETSVTAMTLTAMARGLRLGWLDASYRPVVDRAWRALLAHVHEDGGLVDVCFSTGAGPTRRHYLDRPAVNGADDRGGAMVLGAALEYHDLLQAD